MQADTGTFLVGEKGAFAAVQLPYKTKGYSLIVAVNRKKPSTLAEFAAVAGWLTGTGLQTQEARITLPRFAFNYGEDLLPALDALGLEPARSRPSALAGLADSPLQIAAVPHKIAIIVDEGGTIAAAATAITMPTSAPPPDHIFEFVVDKPFMFALRDDNAGMTLMMVMSVTLP